MIVPHQTPSWHWSKNMKNHIAGLALAALFVALSAAQAKAQDKCSNRTTTGKYVVVCNGFLSPAPNAPLVPAKELALAVGDRSGTFTATGTISVGGTILKATLKGTKQLNPDCTGTITYQQTINGQPGLRLTSHLLFPRTATPSMGS
jgi:hypothetical protein